MLTNSESVKKWRKTTKERMVKSMGGECVCCGYNKCFNALSFHHIEPSEKGFSFGHMTANPRKWSRIVEELRKCVLLCNNCHAEVHGGVTKLPETYAKFDEAYVEYRKKPTDACPICNEQKPMVMKTCSRVCAAKKARKVPWDTIDLEQLLKEKSFSKVGDLLNITGTAVRKRAKKLGLIV